MATIDLLFKVKLPSINPNIDDATNAWVWEGDELDGPNAEVELKSFYTAVWGGFNFGDHMHPAIDRTANHCILETYNITAHLNGSPHGSPIAMDTFTISAAEIATPEPPQMAVVVDYHATYGSAVEFGPGTRPRSRLRGRHFWGPLNFHGLTHASVTPFDCTVSNDMKTFLKAAYEGMLATTHFGTGWGVWSRKNASVAPVLDGWIDSTPHVQRRRQDPSGIKLGWGGGP